MLLAALVLLSACGGGGGSGGIGGDRDAFEVHALPYALDGSETSLDLANAQTVLAAALGVVSTAGGLAESELVHIDDHSTEPGHYSGKCDAGRADLDVSEPGGARVYTLDAEQCFRDGDTDYVLDGVIGTHISLSQGVLTADAGTASPFVFTLRGGDVAPYEQLQLAGSLSFRAEQYFSASANGLMILLGKGDAPGAADMFMPTRVVELLAGTSTLPLDFEIQQDTGDSLFMGIRGRVSVRLSGLDAACNFAGSFDVANAEDTGVTIDSGGTPRSGGLILSAGSDAATASFNSDGSIDVSAVGSSRHFTAAEVDALCAP